MAGSATTLSSAASSDLGLDGGGDLTALAADDEKRKKLLQMQRERMGLTGTSVYGAASASILGSITGGLSG